MTKFQVTGDALWARMERAVQRVDERLRKTVRSLVLEEGKPFSEDGEYEDELNPEMLDTVHLMGNRFNRVLQQKLSE